MKMKIFMLLAVLRACIEFISVRRNIVHKVERPPITPQKQLLADKSIQTRCPPALLEKPSQPRLKFIHIPKTGGKPAQQLAASQNISWGACEWLTSIENGGRCPRNKNRIYYHHPIYKTSSWHIPIQHFDSPDHLDLYRWYENASLFAVVRNPHERMVSEWNVHHDKDGAKNNATAMNIMISRDIQQAKEFRRNDMTNYIRMRGAHMIRQVDYVTNLKEQVYILRWENIKEDFDCLMETFGMDLKWQGPEVKTNTAKNDLTEDDLTADTKALITDFYALDFEQFGYEKESRVEQRQQQQQLPQKSRQLSCLPKLLVKPSQPRLQFIHIPKTGGTTAEYLAASQNISWGACEWLTSIENGGKCPRNEDRIYYHHPIYQTSSWHIPIQYFDSPEHPDLYHWYRDASLFAIVRNPYARMVSEWNYYPHDKDGAKNNATAMNIMISSDIQKAREFRKNDMTKYIRMREGHMIRQVDYVTNLKEQVYVLKLENIKEDFDCLMQTFGMDLKWLDAKTNAARNNLTVDDLDDRTKALIASFYALDFEQFGYEV